MSCHHSFRKSLRFHEVGPAAYLPRLICSLFRDPSYFFFFMDTSDFGHDMATERVDMEAAHNASNGTVAKARRTLKSRGTKRVLEFLLLLEYMYESSDIILLK